MVLMGTDVMTDTGEFLCGAASCRFESDAGLDVFAEIDVLFPTLALDVVEADVTDVDNTPVDETTAVELLAWHKNFTNPSP